MYIISFHHQCFQEEGMFALREVVFKCICLLSTRYHEIQFFHHLQHLCECISGLSSSLRQIQ